MLLKSNKRRLIRGIVCLSWLDVGHKGRHTGLQLCGQIQKERAKRSITGYTSQLRTVNVALFYLISLGKIFHAPILIAVIYEPVGYQCPPSPFAVGSVFNSAQCTNFFSPILLPFPLEIPLWTSPPSTNPCSLCS